MPGQFLNSMHFIPLSIVLESVHIVAVVTLPMSVRNTKLSMQEKIELWL